jgi:hypothetical protein
VIKTSASSRGHHLTLDANRVIGGKRAMARRWTDRVVRIYAATALQLAGFSSAAFALSSLPELASEEIDDEARSRVNAALTAVLSAREIPQTEPALVAALAAREALALVALEDPSEKHLKRIIEALHAIA